MDTITRTFSKRRLRSDGAEAIMSALRAAPDAVDSDEGSFHPEVPRWHWRAEQHMAALQALQQSKGQPHAQRNREASV
jgi:glutamate-1-semialdehyde aminotransferase